MELIRTGSPLIRTGCPPTCILRVGTEHELQLVALHRGSLNAEKNYFSPR